MTAVRIVAILTMPGRDRHLFPSSPQAGGGWVLHMGRWSEGKRNGPGIVVTSGGEEMQGFFMDDIIWGPAEYRFAPMAGNCGSQATGASMDAAGQPPRHRLRFAGMMNGRPQGRGCMSWSDGTQEMGQVRSRVAGGCRHDTLSALLQPVLADHDAYMLTAFEALYKHPSWPTLPCGSLTAPTATCD